MKLVDLPTAKVLQELGYDGEYSKVYNTSDQLTEIDEIAKPYCTPAPRLDDVAYWLRDKCDTLICVDEDRFGNKRTMYYAKIRKWSQRGEIVYAEITKLYDTYETALEDTVKKAIKIVSQREKFQETAK